MLDTASPDLLRRPIRPRGQLRPVRLRANQPPDVTVVAVGGYGRRELFPLLRRRPASARRQDPRYRRRQGASIAEFLRILWDEGYRVSHSVRTVADCCELHEGNLELTISLLDQRYLCGDPARFDEPRRAFPQISRPRRKATIARDLCKSARDGTPNTGHHLSSGAERQGTSRRLRDIHVIHWLAKIGAVRRTEDA